MIGNFYQNALRSNCDSLTIHGDLIKEMNKEMQLVSVKNLEVEILIT